MHSIPSRPSIFLDTTVLKASVDTRMVFLPEPQKVEWGDQKFELNVHKPVFVNQNLKFLMQGSKKRFLDTVVLRHIAAFARESKIDLVCHKEVFFELMGLPRTIGHEPRFHGATIRQVEGPISYSRIVADGTRRNHQYEFLSGVKHPRFEELQRICGAFQGEGRPLHRNQLLDAFHLLCAESAGAHYFLTLDDKLIRTLSKNGPGRVHTKLVIARDLLKSLLAAHPSWLWSFAREQWRLLRSGRRLDAPFQDASREFWS